MPTYRLAELTPGQIDFLVAWAENLPIIIETAEEQWATFARDVNVTRIDPSLRETIRASLKPRTAWRCYEGDEPYPSQDGTGEYNGPPSPTRNWALAGPIIERERISVAWDGPQAPSFRAWAASIGSGGTGASAATPLRAAMLAYLSAKNPGGTVSTFYKLEGL